jgi:hypothetical protein
MPGTQMKKPGRLGKGAGVRYYCHGCHTYRGPRGYDYTLAGERRRTCKRCLEESRTRDQAASAEALQPITWAVVRKCYHLSEPDAKLVEAAARRLIESRDWMANRKGAKPECADSMIRAHTPDLVRQCELLQAASRRAQELLFLAGHDIGAYWNRGIRTPREAA